MPDELRAAWPCWRLVAERRATFTEVSTTMSIDDVDLLIIACDLLDEPAPQERG